MSNLNSLLQSIETLDPKHVLRGVAYDLTTNVSLGLTGQALDFCAPMPYNPWPVDKNPADLKPEDGSALKDAMKDVLEKGVAAFLEGDNKQPTEFVIDITTLDNDSIL